MSKSMTNKGVLVVLSGFSGAGKGTVVKRLLEKYDNYALSVSATTRSPREGEEEGKSYFFRTREQFEQMIQNNELIEYAEYVNNYYGTPRAYVDDRLNQGYDVILEIEIQGALNIRKMYPDAVLIFITPPSFDELEERLLGRGTESPEVIRNRMRQASYESGIMPKYDYLVTNTYGSLEECVDQVHEIIHAAHYKVSANDDLVAKIQEQARRWE